MKENPCSTREIHVLYVESAADQTDHFEMLLIAKPLRTAMTL